MSAVNKVATATLEDADWTFVDEPAVMRAIKNAAIKAANEFELVEFEDAQQDALLWLSVRPEQVQRVLESGDFKSFTQNVYANALRPAAVAESNRQKVTSNYDNAFGEEGD